MNNEFPPHIKRNHDRLQHILKLAKNHPYYKDKSKLEGDSLITNGVRYTVNDIAKLPKELAAFQAAQKRDDQYLAFHGEWSPFSNFHNSLFIIDGKLYHSSEQWIQEQKAVFFNDAATATQILKSNTPLECK